jgi:hypothetical protein
MNNKENVFFSAWQIGEILEQMKIRAEIKKVALTIYLGESNLVCFFFRFFLFNLFVY